MKNKFKIGTIYWNHLSGEAEIKFTDDFDNAGKVLKMDAFQDIRHDIDELYEYVRMLPYCEVKNESDK